MQSFSAGEALWLRRFGNLRNTVRQEVIRRQLAQHVPPDASVLDIGCGQGTQAIELARRGCVVTGVEPSAELREVCRTNARQAGIDVTLLAGSLDDVGDLIGTQRFDAVCAHGLLMYLDDSASALATMSGCLADGGQLSFTFRNGDALAMRPAMRRDWRAARTAFDDDHYVNELGLTARADRLRDVEVTLGELGLGIDAWYGVRVLTDPLAAVAEVPEDDELAVILDAEELAGARDPYRWMASQLHVVARRVR